jgi:hypothetical protein
MNNPLKFFLDTYKYEIYGIEINPLFTMEMALERKHNNYNFLSENPNIALDIVKANLDKPWKWDLLSLYLPINKEDIENNLDLPWKNSYFLQRSFTKLEDNIEKDLKFYWTPTNPNITEKYVMKTLNHPWNFSILSYHKNITWDLIKKTKRYLPWNFNNVCKNPNITWEIMRDNSDIFNDYYYISQNPNLTCDIIQSNLDKPWDWEELSYKIPLSKKILESNYPWYWEYIAKNRSLQWCYIENLVIQNKITDKKFWENITFHPNIQYNIIQNYSDKFNRKFILKNPNLTISDIEDIMKNRDNIDIDCIRENKFYTDNIVKDKILQKKLLKRKIKMILDKALYKELIYLVKKFI